MFRWPALIASVALAACGGIVSSSDGGADGAIASDAGASHDSGTSFACGTSSCAAQTICALLDGGSACLLSSCSDCDCARVTTTATYPECQSTTCTQTNGEIVVSCK